MVFVHLKILGVDETNVSLSKFLSKFFVGAVCQKLKIVGPTDGFDSNYNA